MTTNSQNETQKPATTPVNPQQNQSDKPQTQPDTKPVSAPQQK